MDRKKQFERRRQLKKVNVGGKFSPTQQIGVKRKLETISEEREESYAQDEAEDSWDDEVQEK